MRLFLNWISLVFDELLDCADNNCMCELVSPQERFTIDLCELLFVVLEDIDGCVHKWCTPQVVVSHGLSGGFPWFLYSKQPFLGWLGVPPSSWT